MTHSQYQLWLSTWNKAIREGMPTSEALALADRMAETLKGH